MDRHGGLCQFSNSPHGKTANIARMDRIFMSEPTATVIKDSINDFGVRLTTIEFNIHRYILPELNTHRVFSRSAASSRAIPIEKQIERAINDPALPIHWGKNQPGMSADEELSYEDIIEAKRIWLEHLDVTVDAVRKLSKLGLHKQVGNRLLEPFMWQKVIVTSTEWSNFFKLRTSIFGGNTAQPEFAVAADAAYHAMNDSIPTLLTPGQFHLPYVDDDVYSVENIISSVARCARVSFLNHENKLDYAKDVSLFCMLFENEHMSPFEHVAFPSNGYAAPSNFDDSWAQLRHDELLGTIYDSCK